MCSLTDQAHDTPKLEWERMEIQLLFFKYLVKNRLPCNDFVLYEKCPEGGIEELASNGCLSIGSIEKALIFKATFDKQKHEAYFIDGHRYQIYSQDSLYMHGECASINSKFSSFAIRGNRVLIALYRSSDDVARQKKVVKRTAVVDADGSVWARTEGGSVFRATQQELKRFVGLFDNIDQVPSTGADLEEVHYIVPRTEPNLIFGKKEKSGFFAAKTKNAVLIAVYEEENQVSAEVRTSVKKMAEYLNGVGY